ncbi:mediator of RNA polymerase II transcription subunit 21 isoform X2 [Triticum aestivum]|uniref:mediator of RNA polymerase II transcription subunit 21 isoform X2 n=1 Tax=Triticum aestivum TaxID=4565 RepID=UPI000844F3EB|nr:mediator of RNA polymerase II transcription subunit 21-like isoform X2 [Triticum aestivum]
MDIITQLQEQLNEMAMVAVNTFGTLQRDAPPVRLSNSYPDPLNPNPNPDGPASQPQTPPAPGAPPPAPLPPQPPQAPPQPALDLAEQPKAMSHALVLAAKKFDALVAALPLSSEEDQLKRIQELQITKLWDWSFRNNLKLLNWNCNGLKCCLMKLQTTV